MTAVWAPAALAAVERQIGRQAEDVHALLADHDRWLQRVRSLKAEREGLLNGAVPHRPRRRMPSLKRIARFHGLGDPACYCCGYVHPGEWTWDTANRWLERAHVIDRCFGGLDHEGNLRPLCTWCHRQQPPFSPGEEASALAWVGDAAAPLLGAGTS